MSEPYYGFAAHMNELLARLAAIENILTLLLTELRERVSREG